MQASVLNSFTGPTPGISFDSAYNSVRSGLTAGWSYMRAPVRNVAAESERMINYARRYRGIPFVGEVVDWALTNPLADQVFGFVRSVDEELERIERVAKELETFFDLGGNPEPEDEILREWQRHPFEFRTPQGDMNEGVPHRQKVPQTPAEHGNNHAGGSLNPHRILPTPGNPSGVPLPPDERPPPVPPRRTEDKTPARTDRPQPQPTETPVYDPYMPQPRSAAEQQAYEEWEAQNAKERQERQQQVDQWLAGHTQRGSSTHPHREKKEHHDNDYNPLMPGIGNLPLVPLV